MLLLSVRRQTVGQCLFAVVVVVGLAAVAAESKRLAAELQTLGSVMFAVPRMRWATAVAVQSLYGTAAARVVAVLLLTTAVEWALGLK